MLEVSINGSGNICQAMGTFYGYNWWTAKNLHQRDFGFSRINVIKVPGYTKVGTIPEELF